MPVAELCLLCLLHSTAAGAGVPAGRPAAPPPPPPPVPRTIEAAQVAAGAADMHIDGVFDEPIWAHAPRVTEFLQREPVEGADPTDTTEVQVAYDSTSLYVAIHAIQPPGRIRRLLTRRDEDSPSDWVRVFIDSFHDRRTAFEFSVNAAGVQKDRYWFNDTNNDDGWDAVWNVAVAPASDGWRAEFRIPFSQLRFNPAASSTFGFAIAREIASAKETVTWPLLPKSASGFVSSFGDLIGLQIAPSVKKLEFIPYVVSQVGSSPVDPANPLTRSPDANADAGLDLRYKIARGLTLTGTLNPDFGQVEADPAVVNLSGFETFFAEKRPFFVEGSGNFNFDMDCSDGSCTGLFYSRRIGRAPHRSVDAPPGGFVNEPANTPIVGAAKLTGRLGKFSIGALDAVTARRDARLIDAPGDGEFRTPVEPATNYSIVRVNREFTNQSRLGFMITSVNRALTDELRLVPDTAVTGGVDGDWRFRDGRYSVTGNWAGSTIHGSTDAIADLQTNYVHAFERPDAGHVTFDPTRTRLSGHEGSASINKISGRLVRFNSTIRYKTPGFDTNDIGYLQRADDIFWVNWLQLIHDVPTKRVRSFRINFNQWSDWNFDGDHRVRGGNVNAHWELVNNWEVGSGLNFNSEGFDDRLTRGGPGGKVAGEVSQWGYLTADDRKALSGNFFGSWGRRTDGSWNWSVSPGISLRPSAALETRVGFDIGRNINDAQWIVNLTDTPAKHYVFGRIDQTTVGVSLRLNYTVTSRLSLQLYGQPFVSSGAYTNFRELVNGRAPAYADRYAPFAYTGEPDFNYHSFRTTNVLRWEYRPGSTLFVVWQQGHDATTTQGDFQFSRDFGRAFTTPGTNVFLVKISKWLNY